MCFDVSFSLALRFTLDASHKLDPTYASTYPLGVAWIMGRWGVKRLVVAFPLNIYDFSSCSRVTRLVFSRLDLVS